jgi:dCTP diphosphatase
MKPYEEAVLEYLKERKWDNLRPGDLAKSVAIESAELLELFQWTNPSLEEVKQDPEKLAQIKKELADVLTYCFDISVLLGFDTEAILFEKLEKIKEKYPAHLFNKRADGVDAGSEAVYWEIKKAHRMKGE